MVLISICNIQISKIEDVSYVQSQLFFLNELETQPVSYPWFPVFWDRMQFIRGVYDGADILP